MKAHLLAPLRAVDRVLTRSIVATSIALMRRGIPKSWQMYACWSSYVAGALAGGLLRGTAMSIVTSAILTVILLIVFTFMRGLDEEAERKGALTPHDRPAPWWLKMFGPACVATDALHCHEGGALLFASVVQWSSHLVVMYLHSAPRRPPPKEEKQPADLATEGAR